MPENGIIITCVRCKKEYLKTDINTPARICPDCNKKMLQELEPFLIKGCRICGKVCFPYHHCKTCNTLIKKELIQEAKIELQRQFELDPSERSETYNAAHFEVWHNHCYDDISAEQYEEELTDDFIERYREENRERKIKELKERIKNRH